MVEEGLKAKKFWEERVSKDIPPSNIRLDFNRPDVYCNEKETVVINIGQDITQKLNKLTGEDNFLLYTFLMSVLGISLRRYSGTPDILVGSPVLRTEGQIDGKNRAVVVKIDIDTSATFRQLLIDLRSNLLETYRHQDYSPDSLIDEFNIERKENKCTLFDVALEVTNIHSKLNDLMNDITLSFKKEDVSISGKVIYNSSLFRRDTIEQFVKYFTYVIEKTLADTNITAADLIGLSEEEKQELFQKWNDTETDYPKEFCVHQLFELQVERTPNAVALCQGNKKMTYSELNSRANRLARHLKNLNIKPGSNVGLFIDRSPEMIIGLLGVLKSGGAYVPIDPNYPKDRVVSMLDSVELPVLLTRERLLEKLPDNKSNVICLDTHWPSIEKENNENLKNVVSVGDLAYVIFTSGSTGVPKAAAVYHKGWTNLLNWFSKQYSICSQDKVLIISSFSFDITQRSIAMPLINGGELHLLASDFYDPDLITKTISEEGITLLNCSPSTFYPLVENKKAEEYKNIKSLRCLFLGGEAISASRLSKWASSELCSTLISNVYGAAECSDVSSFYHLKDFDRYMKSSVSIGKPIYNTKIYILDENLEPVPAGVVGEICLAGEGVGKGYINDEELTEMKFVKDPFSKDEDAKMYRTGDLGRFMPDGNLEFNGRLDYQIKIRGLRVELGDIESVIRQHPSVEEAVVIDKEFKEGDHRLISYIVLKQEAQNSENADNSTHISEQVRLFAKEKLPAYMVPNFMVILEKLPLSPNGKIDRKALKKMDLNEEAAYTSEFTPQMSLENELTDIFKSVLNVNQIGISDNIFDKGGHSLLVTQIIATVNSRYNLNLVPFDIYAEPSVAGLSKRMKTAMANKN